MQSVFLVLNQARRSLSTIFLGGFIVLGIVSTFVLAPFQLPDEATHWQNFLIRFDSVFHTTNAVDIRYTGLPDHFDVERIKFQYAEKMRPGQFASLDAQPAINGSRPISSYGRLYSYPAQIIAIAISHFHNSAPGISGFYLSRLLNGLMIGLIFGRLLFLSRQTPSFFPGGILSLLALALSPLFIQQSFAVSADVVCNAFFLSAIPLFLFPTNLKSIDVAIFSILGIFACLTKPSLIPVFSLSIIVYRYLTAPNPRAFSVLKIALPIGLLAGLLLLVSSLLNTAFLGSRLDIDPIAQMEWVAKHPFSSINLITSQTHAYLFNVESLSGPLGWMDNPISGTFHHFWLALLGIAFLMDLMAGPTVSAKIHLIKGAWLIVIGLLTSYVAMIILYLIWTPVGAPSVDGFQGRYLFATVGFILIGTQQMISSLLAKLRPRFLFLHDFHRNNSDPASTFIAHTLIGPFAVIAMLVYTCYFYLTLAQRYW
jgi:uncharacterized membrane protein